MLGDMTRLTSAGATRRTPAPIGRSGERMGLPPPAQTNKEEWFSGDPNFPALLATPAGAPRRRRNDRLLLLAVRRQRAGPGHDAPRGHERGRPNAAAGAAFRGRDVREHGGDGPVQLA